jgi:hypothetical protein
MNKAYEQPVMHPFDVFMSEREFSPEEKERRRLREDYQHGLNDWYDQEEYIAWLENKLLAAQL